MESYHVNFSLDETKAIRAFFETNGYVVVRDVLNEDECAATRLEMEQSIQTTTKQPAFRMEDSATHDFTGFNNYGMWTSTMFTPQLLLNRSNPKLLQAFSLLYDEDESNLLVNHDSGCFYRPSLHREGYRTEYTYPGLHVDFAPKGYLEEETIKTKRNAMRYTSINDWMLENNLLVESDGMQLAGVINLYPNREEDGGFQCAAGFRQLFPAWVKEKEKKGFDDLVGSYTFSSKDKVDMKYLTQCETMRVSAPAGALIIWDQLMAHGSVPNRSERFRCAQFVKVFRKALFTKERLAARGKALRTYSP